MPDCSKFTGLRIKLELLPRAGLCQRNTRLSHRHELGKVESARFDFRE